MDPEHTQGAPVLGQEPGGCGCGCSGHGAEEALDMSTREEETESSEACCCESAEEKTEAGEENAGKEDSDAEIDVLDPESPVDDDDDAGQDLLAAAEARAEELTSDLQRLSAEYANYRRRVERERHEAVASGRAKVVTDLLPLVDDFDMAAQHGDLESGPLKVFHDKFTNVLTTLGLERFGVAGEDFDPAIHEAIQDSSTGDHKVLGTVLRPGYRLQGNLLRTAMVIIADPDAENQDSEE